MLIDKFLDRLDSFQFSHVTKDGESAFFDIRDAVVFNCEFTPTTKEEELFRINEFKEGLEGFWDDLPPEEFSTTGTILNIPENEYDFNVPYDVMVFEMPLAFTGKKSAVMVVKGRNAGPAKTLHMSILDAQVFSFITDKYGRGEALDRGTGDISVDPGHLFSWVTALGDTPDGVFVNWNKIPVFTGPGGTHIVDNPTITASLILAVNVLKLLSLINCKNVTTITHHAPEKLQKARRKKNKLPLLSYKTIEINLADDAPRHVTKYGETKGNSQGTRLHMIKGHYRTYTKEKPLFGRHVGRWWWQPRAGGDIRNGKIEKDYRVTA
jgi:hypothetical protein